MAAADEDPVQGRPEGLECEEADVLEVDFGYLEIDTDSCDWVTVVQPAIRSTAAGDPIDFVVFHSALAAPGEDNAVAHLSLTWGVHELWSTDVPIPAGDEVYAIQMDAPADLAEGDPVAFHVDNHGANSYRFAHMRVIP